MQALQFPRGNVYQLVCQDGNQALKIQAADYKQYDKSRIIGVAPNANDLGQLWMIEKVGHGDDEFEVVNCQSNLVWDEDGSEIRLRFGNQSKDQLFKVEKYNNNAFWFKTSAKGDEAVALEGVLRYKKFDPNVLNQIFYVVPVNNSTALNETCILVNANSGKTVDIPGATFEHGERLIQYEKNKRFNQRWRWIKNGNGWLLQSVMNGQIIDIAEEKKTSGSKIVQWDKTGASNQQWAPVPSGQGVWKIKSIHAPGLFLSIKDNEVNDGGRLEISDGDRPSQLWRIEGFVPAV
jgi:hypothetical protein